MAKLIVNLQFDASGIETAIASLLALVETPDRPAKARRAFGKRVLNLFDKGLAIDFDPAPALRAGKMIVGAKPSQRLFDLVAAFGAGD